MFPGPGTIPREHSIFLRPDAKPFAVATPRGIPFPISPAVKRESGQLEAEGIVRKAYGPTDWSARIVLLQNSSGAIRLCVDLTKLNVSVRR